LAAFSDEIEIQHNHHGDMDTAILFVMAVLEEIAIVGICLGTGLLLSARDVVTKYHLFIR
jgi:hypothetical protein